MFWFTAYLCQTYICTYIELNECNDCLTQNIGNTHLKKPLWVRKGQKGKFAKRYVFSILPQKLMFQSIALPEHPPVSSPGSCVQRSAQPSGLRFPGYKSSLRAGWWVGCWWVYAINMTVRLPPSSLLTTQWNTFWCMFLLVQRYSCWIILWWIAFGINHMRNNPDLDKKNLPQRSGLEDDFLGLKETATTSERTTLEELQQNPVVWSTYGW